MAANVRSADSFAFAPKHRCDSAQVHPRKSHCDEQAERERDSGRLPRVCKKPTLYLYPAKAQPESASTNAGTGMCMGIGRDEQASRLLQRYAAGDAGAYDQLFGLIHDDLRRRAHRWSSGPNATLSTTALVHETWLKLADTKLSVNDRAHFFRLAARAMRNVLIDAARQRDAQKRGAAQIRETLDGNLPAPVASSELFALDRALKSLAVSEPRLSHVVELHFFAGLDFVAIAPLLGLSERTVRRDWRTARALLRSVLDTGAAMRGPQDHG